MKFAHCKHMIWNCLRTVGLTSGVLIGLLCTASWAQEPVQEPSQKAIQEPGNSGETNKNLALPDQQIDIDVDWRDALLTELATLANTMEKQQKFNSILRDKIDILNHRIDQLQESNDKQAKRITELSDAQSQASSKVQLTPKGDEQARLSEKNDVVVPDQSSPETVKPKASAPAAKDQEESKQDMPADFEQFLDMGEAMMRRFFGVVKEFRKEFDENRV